MKLNSLLKQGLLSLGLTLASLQAAQSQCMSIGTNLGSPSDWAPNGTVTFKAGLADGTGEEWSNTTNPWDATFLNEINNSKYSTIRFMDWGGTNWSTLVNWADRTKKTDNNYGAGCWQCKNVAYEWMIDLCNRTNKNMWINIPHAASDDFVNQLAALLKNNLNSWLKVYVEYSNETWNTTFNTRNGKEGQHDYVNRRARELNLPGQNDDYKGQAFYMRRSARIFELFQNAFAGTSNRLRKVVAFSGNEDWARYSLSMLDNRTVVPSTAKPDYFAVAPYIEIPDGGASNAVQLFKNAVDASVAAGGYIPKFKTVVDNYNGSHTHKLGFMAYEGGQHIFNSTSKTFAQNPGSYDAYAYMLTKYKPYFSLYMHFVHASKWDQYDAWGAKAYYGQPDSEAHKWRALRDFMNNNPNCWAPRVNSESKSENQANDLVTIAPNPSKDQFTVRFNSNSDNTQVQLIDMRGRTLTSQDAQGKKEVTIRTAPYSPGLYLVKIVRGLEVNTYKVVVER